MRVLLFLTADYANIERSGKINVMGVFRKILATNFPARHPSMHLVIKLGAELGESREERDLTIKLFNEDRTDEKEIISTKFQFPTSPPGQSPEYNVVLGLKDIVFNNPGTYEFVILVDKSTLETLPIFVEKTEFQEG